MAVLHRQRATEPTVHLGQLFTVKQNLKKRYPYVKYGFYMI